MRPTPGPDEYVKEQPKATHNRENGHVFLHTFGGQYILDPILYAIEYYVPYRILETPNQLIQASEADTTVALTKSKRPQVHAQGLSDYIFLILR